MKYINNLVEWARKYPATAIFGVLGSFPSAYASYNFYKGSSENNSSYLDLAILSSVVSSLMYLNALLFFIGDKIFNKYLMEARKPSKQFDEKTASLRRRLDGLRAERGKNAEEWKSFQRYVEQNITRIRISPSTSTLIAQLYGENRNITQVTLVRI